MTTLASTALLIDLVQIALLRALGALESFEPGRPGAFLADLRQILQNAVRDERCRNPAEAMA